MDALQTESRLSKLLERSRQLATKSDLIVAAIIQAALAAFIAAMVTRLMI